MIIDELSRERVRGLTPEGLRTEYETNLIKVVGAVGVDVAAERSDVDRPRLDELVSGGSPELTVDEVASLLSLGPEGPDAETIRAEMGDRLLMDMTTAVVDVDALAANVAGDLDAREVQRRVEGRSPMTLEEYARFRHFLATRRP